MSKFREQIASIALSPNAKFVMDDRFMVNSIEAYFETFAHFFAYKFYVALLINLSRRCKMQILQKIGITYFFINFGKK